MRYAISSVVFVAMTIGASTGAVAQQALTVDIKDELGDQVLQRDAIGCFDVLAAIRLQKENSGGDYSAETRAAFSSGSYVVAASGLTLAGAQAVEIADAPLVRGAEQTAKVTLYFPEDYFNSDDDNAGAVALIAIADALLAEVADREQCASDRDDLDARIVDFNARVDAYLAVQSEDTVETGSRLKENDSVSVTSVRLSDGAGRDLRDESVALKTEAEAHEQRCGAYREGLVLDQDYMPYYRATRGARS